MKWRRDKAGSLVPEQDDTDRAAEFYDLTPDEASAHRKLQAAMESNPRLRKQVVKRIRRMQHAQGMAPSIKTRRAR